MSRMPHSGFGVAADAVGALRDMGDGDGDQLLCLDRQFAIREYLLAERLEGVVEPLSYKTIRPHNAHAEYLSFSAMVIPFESVRAAVLSDLLRRMSGGSSFFL